MFKELSISKIKKLSQAERQQYWNNYFSHIAQQRFDSEMEIRQQEMDRLCIASFLFLQKANKLFNSDFNFMTAALYPELKSSKELKYLCKYFKWSVQIEDTYPAINNDENIESDEELFSFDKETEALRKNVERMELALEPGKYIGPSGRIYSL